MAGPQRAGYLRAVKIVQRSLFEDSRPYQRELNGIRHYEAISRGHEGLIDVLHVGRNDEEGYFYYVMELADDQVVGQSVQLGGLQCAYVAIGPQCPRILADRRMRLHRGELADALHYLHAHGLVHRDIKPSNIVYVNGRPKLADIGLVAGSGVASGEVGTLVFCRLKGPAIGAGFVCARQGVVRGQHGHGLVTPFLICRPLRAACLPAIR